jgi:hypothetical protein
MDMPSSEKDVGSPNETTAKPRRPVRTVIVAAVAAALVLGVGIPIAFTATPRQCASCHEMKPYYDSMIASSHREAVHSCQACHAKPGVLNLVRFELGVYGMISAHFAGAEVKSTSANAPSVESCARPACHSLNRETSNSGDLKINHRLHVRTKGIACPACHPGAVHTGVGGRLKLPPPQLCKQCHADKMNDCAYCHSGQRTPPAPATH